MQTQRWEAQPDQHQHHCQPDQGQTGEPGSPARCPYCSQNLPASHHHQFLSQAGYSPSHDPAVSKAAHAKLRLHGIKCKGPATPRHHVHSKGRGGGGGARPAVMPSSEPELAYTTEAYLHCSAGGSWDEACKKLCHISGQQKAAQDGRSFFEEHPCKGVTIWQALPHLVAKVWSQTEDQANTVAAQPQPSAACLV